MQIGMVGLGKMGANMVRRLGRDGHELLVYDVSAQAAGELASEMAAVRAVDSPPAVIEALEQPRIIWLMVPH